MKAITDCLAQGEISYTFMQLRILFQKFLDISQEFFGEDRGARQSSRPECRVDSSPPFPVSSPFSLPLGANDLSFNPYMLTEGESYTDMLGMSESDLFLSYGGSVFE